MIIIYKCENCDSKRYFSTVQISEVVCKKCNSKMIQPKTEVTSEVMTTEESRYLGDEALYNTVGGRVSEKYSKHFTTAN